MISSIRIRHANYEYVGVLEGGEHFNQWLVVADSGVPRGGRRLQRGTREAILFCKIFAENCIKIKDIGHSSLPPPPRSTTGLDLYGDVCHPTKN